ncbi:RecX family transcriptional regulator [Zymomonas sp.]|uniref:regulatory protein RecX n=1 Tax=Zymomonas sp. TaxID=2068624 RepID=UPI0025D2757B|nr:RecX family transcriptional regulator [Zymomonas sp.]MCA1955396.1 RecX family transcriptional regulator [Zymomonas sp.]
MTETQVVHHHLKNKQRKPLDEDSLRQLALYYVGRYATSSKKLSEYLKRKINQSGWIGTAPPDIYAIISYCINLGYINDPLFAEMKYNAFKRRGYGKIRVKSALKAAGIDEKIIDSLTGNNDSAMETALHYAQKRHLGPFYEKEDRDDIKVKRRHFAAMARAGHSADVIARIFKINIEDLES